MNTYRYALSLRVSSEVIAADEILQSVGLEGRIRWRMGEPRITPEGRALGGNYPKNFVLFDLLESQSSDEEDLPEALERFVHLLLQRKDFFRRLYETGGESNIFIGWFVDGNAAFSLPSSLLRDVAEIHTELMFDAYPDDEKAKED